MGTFQEVSFEATLPSHVNDVKSQIDGENHVTWSAGDAVKICMPAHEGRALFKGTWNTSAQCKSDGFVFYPQSVEFESIVNNTNPSYAPITKADLDANNAQVTFLNICSLLRITLPARGATNSFFVVANNPVSVSSPSNGWLSVTYDGSQVTVVAAANTEPVERTATITITSADITKTVTVTQPPVYYRSSTGSPITAASDLEDGAFYMIYFATGTNNNQIDSYCWKTDYTNGDVSAYKFSDKTANATCDLVFKYHKTSSISGSWKTDSQREVPGCRWSDHT